MNWLLGAFAYMGSYFQRLFTGPQSSDPLVALILANTIAIGPMPRTHGVVHRVSLNDAILVAGLIRQYAKAFVVRVSLVWALINQESRADANAIDPNAQLDKPGETADQKAEHSDLGIEQEDVSTAEGDPEFKGLTLAQIEMRLLSPDYGVRFVCATLSRNISRARQAFADDPSLKNKVPNGDPEVLGVTAYNAGFTGALRIAHTSGLGGNWSYGLGIVARAKAHPELDA